MVNYYDKANSFGLNDIYEMKPVGGLNDLAHGSDRCLECDLFKLGVHLALPEVTQEAALHI